MKKTYDDFVISAAKECAANLKPEEIEYIKTNISYSSHHFLYGMAIRNKYASKRIRSNFDMAKYALLHTKDEIGDQTFGYLSADLRDNKQLAMIELKHIDPAIEHFSKRLQNDDEISEYIYRRKRIRWGMNYMSKRLQKKYKWISW